ncbi:MAG: ABC transporter permease [Lachnospiraceae bacterium]
MDNKKIKRKSNSAFAIFMRKILRRREAVAGAAILVILAVLAALAPWISKYPYDAMDIKNAFSSPSVEHIFGTDHLGRDMLSRIMYGGRFSLSVGIVSVAISAAGGMIFGSIAGYFGGKVDNLIMRFMDIFNAIPQVLLAVCISAALGTGFFKTVFAIGIGGIPNFSRVIRANILSVRQLDYVEAATSINCSNPRIIFRHVVPNALTPFLVQCTLAIANGLIVAATLSYIGLGVQPPLPEWGAMLSDSRNYIRQYPYLMICPGIFIMITVLSFNLIGDAVRDALDPKLKK